MIGRALRGVSPAPAEARGRVLGEDVLVPTGGQVGGMAAERALTIPVFYSGVARISEATRSMPMELLLKDADGWQQTPAGLRLEQLLTVQPNPEQSAAELYELVTAWMILRGDAYGWKERDASGRVVAIWPIPPHRVQVVRNVRTRRKEFVVYASSEDPTPVWSGTVDDLIHWRGWGTDPLRGLGVVDVMRGLLTRTRDEEDHAGTTMKNMQRPSGVLLAPPGLSRDAEAKLARGWAARARGGTPILPDGIKYERVSLSAADSQFIEQRRFSRGEFALAFRLPASMVLADTGGSLRYDSAAMDGQYFLTHTMMAWKSRLEDPLKIDGTLPWGYTAGKPGRLYPVMNTAGFTRADDLKRAQANHIGVQAGWLLRSEVRRADGLPEVDGIDAMPVDGAMSEQVPLGADDQPSEGA